MSIELRHRRGTTAQHTTFTGALAEVTVDTDKKTVVVHDGSTAGGTPLAKESHNHTGVYEPADGTILKSANIGSTVQAYDVDTAKTDVAQNWTASQRSGFITDNDLSFDLSGAGNNYVCTPTGGGTLTFTNIASNGGKSGYIKLVNGSNYAIAAAATTKILSTDLTKISATGTYILSYICDGTNVYVTTSGNLA